MATTLINDYEVMYSANAFPPRIWLSSAGKFIGQLIFHPDGTALPPDGLSGGQVNLQFTWRIFIIVRRFSVMRRRSTCSITGRGLRMG